MNDTDAIIRAESSRLEPPERRPVRLDTNEIQRMAENELGALADILHEDWGYPADWTDDRTAREIADIVDEMQFQLKALRRAK